MLFRCVGVRACVDVWTDGRCRYRKIVGWEKWLRFPEGVHLSRESEDLMRRYATIPTHIFHFHTPVSSMLSLT